MTSSTSAAADKKKLKADIETAYDEEMSMLQFKGRILVLIDKYLEAQQTDDTLSELRMKIEALQHLAFVRCDALFKKFPAGEYTEGRMKELNWVLEQLKALDSAKAEGKE